MGETPVLSIRVQGRWKRAAVLGREDRADGSVVYLVEITLTGPGGLPGTHELSYLWDPATMHPAPPIRGLLRPSRGLRGG